MPKFYSSVQTWGNNLLVRGINARGQQFQKKVKFKPSLFIPSTSATGYRSLFGEHLKQIQFDDINAAKDFVRRYENVDSFKFFGNTAYNYQYIAETYPDHIDFDMSLLKIISLDIETTSKYGFPSVSNPIEEILLITLLDKASRKKVTFGIGPFDLDADVHIKDKTNFTYIECSDESDLIDRFLRYWRELSPDVITGWYIHFFDIPYLVERIKRTRGEHTANMMSPWDIIKSKEVEIQGRLFDTKELLGIATLDYLDLYQKFTYVKRENYKLDTIAFIELEENKLENPYDTMQDFVTKDWNLFVSYNVVDTELVDKLDDKMRLIELALTMAYDARCNYSDVFSPVKVWDCLIYSHCWNKKIVVHQRKSRETRQIKGGYVSEPKPGKYEWVVSFDATSLYPSIIMQYNISPEKLVEDFAFDAGMDKLLESEYDLTILKDKDYAMTANGHCFRRDGQGIMPEIVERLFAERVKYKKEMIQCKKTLEAGGQDDESERVLKNSISKFSNMEQARKILLNSLYGAMANAWFRFSDNRMAEGITLTGQYMVQSMSNMLNDYLAKTCKTGSQKYSFYSDTDSCYITLKPLVEKYYSQEPTEKIITILDTICKERIAPALDIECKRIFDYTNAFQNKLSFKRESICDHALWVAKKKYALNVWDSEGVRYKEAKLKVTGLEIVRSSTPAAVRESLKKAVKVCLVGTEKDLHAYIDNDRELFKKLTLQEIAFPRGVNGLKKFGHEASIYSKGTPMHVRAALLYNFHIKKLGLDKKYQLIQEGEKIKFINLIEPNPIGENVIGFMGDLPKELNLTTYIDYDTMYKKTTLAPIDNIISALGWTTEPKASLSSLWD